MTETLLIELGIMIVVGLLVSGLAASLKQPLIIGYILAGIILGPNVLNVIKSTDAVGIFAHLGVVVLLFMVGLNLSPKVFREVGRVSLVTGLGQIIFTSIFGFIISYLLGFSILTSAYVSIALTFSSTIIIMKILSDKDDLDTLYGRISVGFLLVQDLVAMVLLVVITSLTQSNNVGEFSFVYFGKVIGLLLAILLFSKYILPRLMKLVAKSQEYLLLFSLGWCLLFAILFYEINFSIEIGALLAGVLLSVSPYRHEIFSKMKPLRDFFIFLFFISLGSQMVLTNLGDNIIAIIVFSLFILIGNPLIVLVLMGRMGYSKKTGFLAGLTVAQISEFSLILISLGVRAGHLSAETLSMVTLIGLITIGASTYAMIYVERFYPFLSDFLSIFENSKMTLKEQKTKCEAHEIILFGYDKIGFSLLKSFKKMGKKFLVVDYSPEIIKFLQKSKVNCLYGDADDVELLDDLCLSKSKMVVSTIPDFEINLLITRKIREFSDKTIIILVSNHIEESIRLYEEGATYVIIPRFLGGEYASALIEKNGFNLDLFLEEKLSHLDHLGDRKRSKNLIM